jgi:hypothetical protein
MLREISFFHRGQTGIRESSKPANVASKMNAVLIIQFKYQPDSLTVNVVRNSQSCGTNALCCMRSTIRRGSEQIGRAFTPTAIPDVGRLTHQARWAVPVGAGSENCTRASDQLSQGTLSYALTPAVALLADLQNKHRP